MVDTAGHAWGTNSPQKDLDSGMAETEGRRLSPQISRRPETANLLITGYCFLIELIRALLETPIGVIQNIRGTSKND